MPARRLRLWTILSIVAVAALTILAGTQTWWVLTVLDMLLEVPGGVASPALSALAITELALAAALGLAGPGFRVVFGLLQVLIGGTVLVAAGVSIADPASASASLIASSTGLSGAASTHQLVSGVAMTAWPFVAIAAGVLAVLLGVLLLVTVRRWPVGTRKYQAVRLENASEPDHARDWDALSGGEDPTGRE